MSKDPIAPVLAYKHYPALERRLHKIMQYVLECLDKTAGAADSVVMNEYHNSLVADEANEDEKTKEEDDVVPQQQQQAPPQNEVQQNEALVPPPADDQNQGKAAALGA